MGTVIRAQKIKAAPRWAWQAT